MSKTKNETLADNLLAAAQRFQREYSDLSLSDCILVCGSVTSTWESPIDINNRNVAIADGQRKAEELRLKKQQQEIDAGIAKRRANETIAPPLKTAPDAVVPNGQVGRTARTGLFTKQPESFGEQIKKARRIFFAPDISPEQKAEFKLKANANYLNMFK